MLKDTKVIYDKNMGSKMVVYRTKSKWPKRLALVGISLTALVSGFQMKNIMVTQDLANNTNDLNNRLDKIKKSQDQMLKEISEDNLKRINGEKKVDVYSEFSISDIKVTDEAIQKMRDFLQTEEGKLICKYSSIYGVDAVYMAAVYMATGGVEVSKGSDIVSYNYMTQENDEHVVTNESLDDKIMSECMLIQNYLTKYSGNYSLAAGAYVIGDVTLDEMLSDTDYDLEDYQDTFWLNNPKLSSEIVEVIEDIFNNYTRDEMCNYYHTDGYVHKVVSNLRTNENVDYKKIVEKEQGIRRPGM